MTTPSFLKSLYIKDFRSYREQSFSFSPGINVIYGSNASGKTNLLEAITLLSTGRSFRTSRLGDLIRFGAKRFVICARFEKNNVEQMLTLSYDGKTRQVVHNNTPLPTLSSLLGILTSVLLSPEDSALVKGSPKDRRAFLDVQLAQASPLYLHHLSRYKKSLLQRNQLLKQNRLETIGVWEKQMAPSAAFITEMRQKSATELITLAAALQLKISDERDALSLKYRSPSKAPLVPYFEAQWRCLREKESLLGKTLTGPHRDDLAFFVGGKEAKSFTSEGQMRSTIAALRLGQWELLKEQTETLPLMCIDDIEISLDAKRVGCLTDHLSTLGQVFLTTPSKAFAPPDSHQIEISTSST